MNINKFYFNIFKIFHVGISKSLFAIFCACYEEVVFIYEKIFLVETVYTTDAIYINNSTLNFPCFRALVKHAFHSI